MFAELSATATTDATTTGVVDTAELRTSAQSAYATAYEQYQNGAWVQANLTSIGASVTLSMTATVASDGEFRFERVGHGGMMPGERLPGGIESTTDLPREENDERLTPVDVPEAVFE